MVVPKQAVLLALIRALAHGHDTEGAVRAVAAELCLPEEAVQEVVEELEGQPA